MDAVPQHTAARPTITDVAGLAGTSKGTVSLVINGRPGIAPATRERVLKAVATLGFSPSAAARRLSTARAETIGMILVRRSDSLRVDPFFAPFIAGIQAELAAVSHSLLLRFVDETEESTAYQTLIASRQVDGFILTDLRSREMQQELLVSQAVPAVIAHRGGVRSPFVAVIEDERPAIHDLADHLAGLGHRRIAWIGGPSRDVHGQRRLRTWRAALRRRSIDPGPEILGELTPESAQDAVEGLLAASGRKRPTAIVFTDDRLAAAGMARAASMGLRVPADVSVVGFGDAPASQFLNPPLTTMSTDAFTWGKAISRTLLAVIAGDPPAKDVHVGHGRLVVRASTGPTRARH